MKKSKYFVFLIALLSFPNVGQSIGVPLEDPDNAVGAVDQMLSLWSFEEAFHLGDQASYYQNYCRSVSGEWRCSLLPATRTVVKLSEQEATIETKFEGIAPREFTVTRDFFTKSKNFLKYFFANLECKQVLPDGREITCPAKITDHSIRGITLSDGTSYNGTNIEFTLQSLKGRMFLGYNVPWVARAGIMEMPGQLIPDEILIGYSRKK